MSEIAITPAELRKMIESAGNSPTMIVPPRVFLAILGAWELAEEALKIVTPKIDYDNERVNLAEEGEQEAKVELARVTREANEAIKAWEDAAVDWKTRHDEQKSIVNAVLEICNAHTIAGIADPVDRILKAIVAGDRHHSEVAGGSTSYPCRHQGCGRLLSVKDGTSFLDVVAASGWVARRYVGRRPDLWCLDHAHERPVVRPDLTIVDNEEK